MMVGGVGNGTPLARFFVAVKTAFFARENGFLGFWEAGFRVEFLFFLLIQSRESAKHLFYGFRNP